MMRLAPLFLLLALGACAHRPNEVRYETVISYDCDESAVTEDGTLRATHWGLGWSRDLGDGMRWSLSLTLIGDEEVANLAAKGFHDQRFGRPIIFVDFAERFKELGHLNFWDNKGRPHLQVASVIRIGNKVKRQWVPVNMVAGLDWAELEQMLVKEGDLTITLYNADGNIYQSATVPRAALARVEQALKAMHARVLAKERDREHLCVRKEERQAIGGDIIIVE